MTQNYGLVDNIQDQNIRISWEWTEIEELTELDESLDVTVLS